MGLNRILSELSKNRTPTELATLTLREAAALRRSPNPQPPTPTHSRSGEPNPRFIHTPTH
ncbi:hypothetical protein SBA4_3530024 [Candidatus Sulfopaludibacter sp. SbA4]|nr:hypothetical protein SBA4_3530024 [Candidatus Sulfopaludibacter sp. SbA4]